MNLLWIYDRHMQLRCVLENVATVSYDLKNNDLSVASFQLPVEDPKGEMIQAHDFVRIQDCGKEIGLFRVITWEGSVIPNASAFTTYQCEHVIATLLDSVMDGDHVIGSGDMTTADVIRYILSFQTTRLWELDKCDFDDAFEYVFSNQDCLTALMSLGKVLVERYRWRYDTSRLPWRLSLEKAPTKPRCGLNYRRNLGDIVCTVDASRLVTRLYPKGNGEGVNQLTIADANGGVPYLDADQVIIDRYGLKEGVYSASDIEDPALLMAKAQQALVQLSVPIYNYVVTALDMYQQTGLDWDRFDIGDLVRMYDADHGMDLITGIEGISKADAFGDPAVVTLTLSTASNDLVGDINSLADRVAINELYSQGTTQMYPLQLADNADPEHPLVMRYYIPSEAKHINKVILSWQIESFRAYSKGASAGGGTASTTEFGGSTTVIAAQQIITSSSWTGEPQGDVRDYTGATTVQISEAGGHVHDGAEAAGEHTHAVAEHNHALLGSPHWHDVDVIINIPSQDIIIPSHDHDVKYPSHSHGISYGIYEGGRAKSVAVKVDGVDLPVSLLAGREVDVAAYLATDESGKIQRSTWHTIEIVPDALTRIVGNLYMQIFIQHRGGGNY